MSSCDLPDFYHETFHVARKQHKCCECGQPIEPGEKYVACRGKWDGELAVFKQHLCCYHVARFVNLELNDDDCIPFGSIAEYLGERCDHDDDDNDINFGVEQCVNIERFWDGWLSGIKEKFAEGAGI